MSSTLASQLSATAEGISKNVAAPVVSSINESIDGLKATFNINSAIQVGASLPAFKLPNALGNEVTSESLLANGPVLITFYRGDWCPYCNLALRSLQLHLDEFHAKGVTMVAISPELPNTSLSTTEKNELKFEVLSDVGNKFARQLGIVWDQPKFLDSVFEAFKVDLNEKNGDNSMALPIPTTLLIDAKGIVRNIHVDPDYRQRLETTTALAWVDAL
ncbi:thioredoxin-like protein [Trichoderma sp. SZMC 28014]